MAKLCVDCVHYRKANYYPAQPMDTALCASTHNHVVGDGIESGSLFEPCWEERSVDKPGEHAFHCGPDARYFELKPVPVETKP